MNPYFSIIIPTHNASKTLSRALESLLIQKCKSFEVLIMDCLSTDDTLLIAEEYRKSLLIRIISESDKGIYDAMNKSLTIANGDWIYFLGSDDRLFNSEVLSTIAFKIKEESDIIYGNSVWWPEHIYEEGKWDLNQLSKRSINHQRIFYKSSVFKRLGNFNTRYSISSDYEMNIRFFCDPKINLQYIDIPIAYYYSHGFSSTKIDINFWDDWNIISKHFRPYLPKSEICLRSAWYCWYNLHEKKYIKSARIFSSIFFTTFNIPFLKHTISQVFKKKHVLCNLLFF